MDSLPAITDCRLVRAPGRPGRLWFTSAATGLDLVLWARNGVLSTVELSGTGARGPWVLRWTRNARCWHISAVEDCLPDRPRHAASALLRGAAPISLESAKTALRGMLDIIPPPLLAQLQEALQG